MLKRRSNFIRYAIISVMFLILAIMLARCEKEVIILSHTPRMFEDPGYVYDPVDVDNSGYMPIDDDNLDDAMKKLLQQVDPTQEGWDVANKTHPHFGTAQEVANNCGIPYDPDSGLFTMGCTYRVGLDETISVLEPSSNIWGIVGSNPKITLIHEMLHSVYSNYVSDDKKQGIFNELLKMYPEIYRQLQQLGYPTEQYDDEMFVRTGSEKTSAPADIAEIYAQYFNMWSEHVDNTVDQAPTDMPETPQFDVHTNPNYTKLQACTVTKPIDGDTLYVDCLKERIRLLGVDTPETVSLSKPVGCYGKEASDYTKQLVGQTVYIEDDVLNKDSDRYNRPLRYIYTSDGVNWNVQLILQGFGKYVPNYGPYTYDDLLKLAEDTAKTNNSGLWSPETCGGITE